MGTFGRVTRKRPILLWGSVHYGVTRKAKHAKPTMKENRADRHTMSVCWSSEA